jgi:hypothetical protein
MCQGAPSCAKVHLHVPRCTFVCQGAPSCAKVRFGRRLKNKMRPRCVFEIRDVPLKVRFHVPRRTLESQGAPWANYIFLRRILGELYFSKVHLGRILYFHQGASWHIKAHLVASRRTSRGAFHISKVHLGTSRCTLAHQGAPWHIKVHLGTPRCALGFQGAPWAITGKPRRALGRHVCHSRAHPRRLSAAQGAPGAVKLVQGASRTILLWTPSAP